MAGLRLIVLCFAVACSTQLTSGFVDPNYSEAKWDGDVAFFAVPRKKVAAKLAELQENSDSDCGADNLALPSNQILPDILDPGQHVVAVSFGKIRTTSVSEDQVDYSSKFADTIQFYIPFLTREGGDVDPAYKLALGSFVNTDRHFANPSPSIQTQPDPVVTWESGVFVRDGRDNFLLSMPVPNSNECVTLNETFENVFEAYNTENTFSFNNDAPCACEYLIHEPHGKKCLTGALRVEWITSKFKRLSLLSREQISIMSVANKGELHIGIEDPCF